FYLPVSIRRSSSAIRGGAFESTTCIMGTCRSPPLTRPVVRAGRATPIPGATMQTELTSNVQESISDVGQWFAANQPRLITAAVLLGLGLVLAFLLRMLAIRIVSALERAVPGR